MSHLLSPPLLFAAAAVDSSMQVQAHLVLTMPCFMYALCLSALFPGAFSDATGACSSPMQVQLMCARVLMPPDPHPRSNLNQCGAESNG